jgi:hypothetical protein
MTHPAIAYLDYGVDRLQVEDETEAHKIKALAAIEHLSGLGKLLRCVGIDTDARPECVKRHVYDLVDGIHTAGDLMVIICDSAYTEVEELFDLAAGVEKIELQTRQD